jgi:hypothetical protein
MYELSSTATWTWVLAGVLLLGTVIQVYRIRYRTDITTGIGIDRIRKKGISSLTIKRTRHNTYFKSMNSGSSTSREIAIDAPEVVSSGVNAITDMILVSGKTKSGHEVFIFSYSFSFSMLAHLRSILEKYNAGGS